METFFEVLKGLILGTLLYVTIHTTIGILIEGYEQLRLQFRSTQPTEKETRGNEVTPCHHDDARAYDVPTGNDHAERSLQRDR